MADIWDNNTLWNASNPKSIWDDAMAWNPSPTKGDVAAQQQADAQAVPDQDGYAGHLVDYLSDSALRGVASLPGVIGDVAKDFGVGAWNLAKGGMHGDVSTMVPQHFPGFDTASQAVQKAVTEHFGAPVQPRNTAEKYLGAAVGGGAAGALTLNPEGALAGAMSGVGGQGGSDLFPGTEWAPFLGSLITPGLSHVGLHALIQHLEGGGSLEHPLVSKKGAVGPMQVMPDTARDPGLGVKPWDGTEKDRVRLGNDYADALDKHYDGDEAKVLAAYNSGFGHVDNLIAEFGDEWKQHLPKETTDYLARAGLLHDGEKGSTGGSVPPIDPEMLAKIMKDNQNSQDLGQMAETLAPHETPDNLINFPEQDNTFIERVMHPDHEITPEDEDRLQQILSDTTPEEKQRISDIVDNLPPELKQHIEDNVLTPAEKQDMDAAVPDYGQPPEAVDASMVGQGADYPEQEPANENVGEGQEPPQEPPSDDGDGSAGGEEPPTGGDMSPEDKLVKAIKEVRPASQETKDMVSQIKSNQSKRLAEIQARGGSLPEQLASLKGELPRADYEPISQHFTPEEVKTLEDKIRGNNSLYPFEKLDVHRALKKLINPDGLSMPTEHELDLLADVYSPNLIKALVNRQKGIQSLNQKIANIGGIPRTLMSSADISAPARQGLLFIGRKEFWKNYPQMIKMFGSKTFYDKAMAEIKERPTYGLMRRGGLAVRDSVLLKDREEYFVSNMAENMPGENVPLVGLLSKGYNKSIGAMVRASDRAYTGFLRKLRADVFDTLTAKGSDVGIDWDSSPEKLKALSNFINTATGRGDLGKFEQASQAFSTIFFAPRLIKARVDTLNPVYYAKLYHADPFIAKEAFKSVASLSAIAATALTLAVAAGAKVEGDIRSADGLKIRIGDTRIDLLGGYQQYLRLIAQMTSDSTKTQKGNIKSLSSGQYGSQTRWDTLMNFGANKLAPILGIARDYLKGTDPGGNKFSAKQDALQAVTPMDITDISDSLKQNGPKGAWVALPAILGVGVQTYTPHPTVSKSVKDPFNDPSVWGDASAHVTDPFSDA